MDINLTEVIKSNIEKGPSYKTCKKTLLEMCKKLGIKTIAQFWDVLIESQRCGCSRNFWRHLDGLCLDSEGDHIAYGKEAISEALGKPENELTCRDICETCGSCAHINRIDYNLFYLLVEKMEEKGLTLDES
jgi:hypothetical protein